MAARSSARVRWSRRCLLVSLAVAGCSSDDAAPDAGVAGDCAANGAVAEIAGNHGHVLVVEAADVVAGVERAYVIRGRASHAHDVTIVAAMFARLRAGEAVVVSSSEVEGHAHVIAIRCG